MGAHTLVVLLPGVDQDVGHRQAEVDFAVEQFVVQLAVETLPIAVLPRAAGPDPGGLGAGRSDSFAQGQGDEFQAVVGPTAGGGPYRIITSAKVSSTSVGLSRRFNLMAKATWVNLSIRYIIRNIRPSWGRCSTRSKDRTWAGVLSRNEGSA